MCEDIYDIARSICDKRRLLLHRGGDYLYCFLFFKVFLEKTYPNLQCIEDEFYYTLYKKFGLLVGDKLGEFVLFSENKNTDDKNLAQLEQVLFSVI